MSDRNKFIDDLIDAGANDSEIEESLKLAESRGEFGTTATPPSQPQKAPVFSPVEAIGKTWKSIVDQPRGKNYYAEGKPLQGVSQDLGMIGRAAGSVIGAPITYAANAFPRATQSIGEFVAGTKAGKNIAGFRDYLQKNYPNTSEAMGNYINTFSVIPIGKTVVPLEKAAIGGTAKAAGNVLEKTGKDVLKGELKIEKPLARSYGPDLKTAKDKIVNTISKYKLESTTGNFEKLSEKAQTLFAEKAQAADDAVFNFQLKNPTEITKADDIFGKIELDIDNTIRSGERSTAKSYLKNIKEEALDKLKKDGADPDNLTPTQLVELKRDIGAKYKNFDRSSEPLKEQIYDNTQSAIIERINSLVPDAKKLNLEARDLKFVQKAAETASARIANQNKGLMGSLSDIGLGSAGALGAFTHPGQAVPILALTAAGLLAKRVAGQGRGSAALMKTGKSFKKLSDMLR